MLISADDVLSAVSRVGGYWNVEERSEFRWSTRRDEHICCDTLSASFLGREALQGHIADNNQTRGPLDMKCCDEGVQWGGGRTVIRTENNS